MCGIILAFHHGDNKQTANEIAAEMMQDQISRGRQGFGSVFIDDKNKFKILRATDMTKQLVDNHLTPSKMILMHHRFPTSSENKISQTHPIIVEHKSLKSGYIVVHNGVIRNDKVLKLKHEKEGFKYTTDDQPDERFNDSECVAIEVAKFIENQTKEIETIGSCAFIALQYNKKTKTIEQVFYGRDDTNPLKLAKSRDILYLTSDSKGDEIKSNTLYSFNLKDFKINKQKMSFATSFTPIVEKEEEKETRITGFTDEEETNKIDNYETAEEIETRKLIITDELDLLFERIMLKDEVWNMDIDRRIRELITTLVSETKYAYSISTDYFADIVIKQAQEEKEAKEEAKAEENAKKDMKEININTCEGCSGNSLLGRYYTK